MKHLNEEQNDIFIMWTQHLKGKKLRKEVRKDNLKKRLVL